MLKELVGRYPTHDIFGVLKVKSKRYDKAVIALWERIFKTEDVFVNLENIDERFEVTRKNEDDMNAVFHKLNQDFKLITKDQFEDDGHFIYKPTIKVKAGEETSDETSLFQKITYKDVLRFIKDSSGESLPRSRDAP
jgi:spore coat protein CotH